MRLTCGLRLGHSHCEPSLSARCAPLCVPGLLSNQRACSSCSHLIANQNHGPICLGHTFFKQLVCSKLRNVTRQPVMICPDLEHPSCQKPLEVLLHFWPCFVNVFLNGVGRVRHNKPSVRQTMSLLCEKLWPTC